MSEIKLIALDLDGTLLRSDKTVSARNAQALRRAAEQGAEIVVASGRYYTGIPEQVRSLPFIRYYICINGAAVFDMKTGCALHREEIPLARAQEIYDELCRLDVIYDCYQDDLGWLDTRFFAEIPNYVQIPSLCEYLYTRRPLESFRQALDRRGRSLQKIQAFFHTTQERDRELARLRALFPDMAISSSMPYNIEINSRRANKGAALQALATQLGLQPETVMAFGDGLNDLTMLQYAGHSVAMENGAAEAKAAARYQAPPNDADGVAQIVEQWFQ